MRMPKLMRFSETADVLDGLPNALKVLRRSRGVSLRKVAAECGLSFSTVSRMEGGADCSMKSAAAILRWMSAS